MSAAEIRVVDASGSVVRTGIVDGSPAMCIFTDINRYFRIRGAPPMKSTEFRESWSHQ